MHKCLRRNSQIVNFIRKIVFDKYLVKGWLISINAKTDPHEILIVVQEGKNSARTHACCAQQPTKSQKAFF